jgi:ribosomal protein L44E
MNASKIYDLHCTKCNKKTQHVQKYQGFKRVAVSTVKYVIFFVTFGMAYPHIFADGVAIAVTCTKCGAQAILSGG